MPGYMSARDQEDWDSLHAAAAMPLDRSYGVPAGGGRGVRALQQLGGDGGPEDVPAGTMRPGLKNALSDASGMEALRQLERRQPTKIDYHDGPANGAFGDRPEYYIPDTMDDDADAERGRQQARANFDVEEPMRSQSELRSLTNKAEGLDYTANLASRRYWDPYTHSMMVEQDQRKNDIVNGPAAIAANSRDYVANATNASRENIASQQQPARDATAAGAVLSGVGSAGRGGAFGIDPATGMPQAPPPNLLERLLPQQKFDAGTESEIQRGVQAGYSRQEVVDHLKKIGRIK